VREPIRFPYTREPFSGPAYCLGLRDLDPTVMRLRLAEAMARAKEVADANPGPAGDAARVALEEARVTLVLASGYATDRLEKACPPSPTTTRNPRA